MKRCTKLAGDDHRLNDVKKIGVVKRLQGWIVTPQFIGHAAHAHLRIGPTMKTSLSVVDIATLR